MRVNVLACYEIHVHLDTLFLHPGMRACVGECVRTCAFHDCDCMGVRELLRG